MRHRFLIVLARFRRFPDKRKARISGLFVDRRNLPFKMAKTVSGDQRPFQFGLRFSAKARGPSTVSSLLVMATNAG